MGHACSAAPGGGGLDAAFLLDPPPNAYILRSARLPGFVWLAAYPRSGVSLMRTILAQCFGVKTGSVYSENILGDGYATALGHIADTSTEAEVRAIASRQAIAPYKTHALPIPGGKTPAIVVVRDGRSVCESLWHFYRRVNDVEIPMADIVRGRDPWGSWTDWLRAWAAHAGPLHTFRFEGILRDVPGAVAKLSEAFGMEPVSKSLPDFDALHAAAPRIWRRGKTTSDGTMTPGMEALFWELHGDTMLKLGYEREGWLRGPHEGAHA